MLEIVGILGVLIERSLFLTDATFPCISRCKSRRAERVAFILFHEGDNNAADKNEDGDHPRVYL